VYREDVAGTFGVLPEFPTELDDVVIYRPRGGIGVVAPDSANDVTSRNGDTRLGDKELEYFALVVRKRYFAVRPLGDETVEVHDHVPDLVGFGGGGRASAAQNRFDASDELADAERFGDVVVGSQFQAEDFVKLGAPGAQHYYGNINASVAKVLAEVEAVHSGEHDVEEYQGRLFDGDGPQRVFGGVGQFDTEVLQFEVILERGSEVLLVFDEKNRLALIVRQSFRPPLPAGELR